MCSRDGGVGSFSLYLRYTTCICPVMIRKKYRVEEGISESGVLLLPSSFSCVLNEP